MTNFAKAYDEQVRTQPEPAVSQIERALLCDLLDRVGPNAPTLAAGWTTHHLVAHLKVREGTPLGVLKMVRPKVGDEEVEALVASGDYSSLVEAIRGGPPRLSLFGTRQSDRKTNTLEFFIHHEDVRRAMPGWERRDLPRWAQDQLWRRTRLFSKALMRKSAVGVELERGDTGETAAVVKRPDSVRLTGLPSELALFAYGRSEVAQVELTGSDAAISAVQTASFGF